LAPRHSPCALCSLTESSIQPGPRGQADAGSSHKLTIGTNFAIGETRFRLPLHLLRFTVRSSPGTAQRSARTRTHDHSEAGYTRTGLLAWPSCGGRQRIFHDTPTNPGGGAEEI